MLVWLKASQNPDRHRFRLQTKISRSKNPGTLLVGANRSRQRPRSTDKHNPLDEPWRGKREGDEKIWTVFVSIKEGARHKGWRLQAVQIVLAGGSGQYWHRERDRIVDAWLCRAISKSPRKILYDRETRFLRNISWVNVVYFPSALPVFLLSPSLVPRPPFIVDERRAFSSRQKFV